MTTLREFTRLKKEYDRVGVHVFGRHTGTVNGQQIMLGDYTNWQLGQLTLAMKMVLEKPVTLFTMGTGASQIDGIAEAEFWQMQLFQQLPNQLELLVYHGTDPTTDQLRAHLSCIMQLDTATKNTGEEITAALEQHLQHGTTELTLISCPSHLPRCVAETYKALVANSERYAVLARGIHFAMSEVPYADSKPTDTVVVEKPHRGDDNSPPFYKLIPRFFRIRPDQKSSFYDGLEALLHVFDV